MKLSEAKNGNVLVITFWSYNDALVQTYTLPYVEMIRKTLSENSKIFIVTFEQPHFALSNEEHEKINQKLSKKNVQLIAFPYKKFGIKKLVAAVGHLFSMMRLIRKDKINVIHAFGPNAGSFGYLLSKMTGKDLIIDSFEPHAEAMVENGTWKRNRGAHFILSRLEKMQAKRAKHLIATSSGMYDYSIKTYGVTPKSFFVKPACVNTDLFFPREKSLKLLDELELKDKITCVYAGKLGGIYFKEEVFDFLKECYVYWGDRFRCVMVTNAPRKEIEQELKRVGLPANIVVSRFVFHKDVPTYLSVGDFAINPVKPVPTKRYCTSIKDGEYWAMGIPVVITPNISDDSEIIQKEGIGGITDFVNRESMANAINKIDTLVKRNNGLSNKIFNVAIKYRSYDIARKIYTEIYR